MSKAIDLENGLPAIKAWVEGKIPPAADATPLMDGTAAVGTSTDYAREDHRHPSDTNKADKTATVSNVAYDSTNKKITKTINGTTSDVVTAATLKTAMGLTKSDVGLGNVDNTADANKSVASAGKLTSAADIDGIAFDGSSDIHHYGTCTTAAGTVAKVATLAGGTLTLAAGALVFIKFTYANTASNPTLNVNSTGAKRIYRYGSTSPSTSAATSWQAGSVVAFVYDGSAWQMVGWLNDNTTYSASSTTPKMNGTAAVGSETAYARGDHVHPSDTTKVDKETGKGLSTNDYTTDEKNKLASIAEGAEVNVQSDWNATSGDAAILNKPAIPSKTSDLTNDSGFITKWPVWYGICQTAVAEGTKTVTCPGFALEEGATVFVWFQAGNSATSGTLNVNGTGAIDIRVQTESTSVNLPNIANGEVVAFTFSHNYWVLINGITSSYLQSLQTAVNGKAPTNHASSATTYGTGTASNYGHVKLSDSTSSTSSTSGGVAATPKAVKDALDAAKSYADGKVTGLYSYKGSVATYANLPASPSTGDVYNVEAAYGDYPAGTNWAWTGTAWDALGGSFTITFATAAEVTAVLNGTA